MRHGLTLGELGALVRAHAASSTSNCEVVAMQGWEPAQGPGFGWPLGERNWVNPSPNAANLSMARCFPGTVMIEGTTLSGGARHDPPLELLGAPDLDAARCSPPCARRHPSGWRAAGYGRAGSSRRSRSTSDLLCAGVQIHVDDRTYDHERFRPGAWWRWRSKPLRGLRPEYPIWREFHYEYEQRPPRLRSAQRQRPGGAMCRRRVRHAGRPRMRSPQQTSSHGARNANRSCQYR